MPKKVDPANKRDRQLLLRITAEELDWLESAAHLDRVTVNAYVHELLQSHVASLTNNNHVKADRDNRRSYGQATVETRRLRPDFAFPPSEVAEQDVTEGAT